MNAMSNPDMAAAFASMMRNNSGVQLNMTRRKQLMPSAASAQVEPLMLANGPAASHNLAGKQDPKDEVDLETSLPSNEEPSIKARPGANEISKARPAVSETSKARPAAGEPCEALPAKDSKELPPLEPKSVDAMSNDILAAIGGQKRKKTAAERTTEGDDVPMPKAKAKKQTKGKGQSHSKENICCGQGQEYASQDQECCAQSKPEEKERGLAIPWDSCT